MKIARILLIEDDLQAASLISALLEKNSYDVKHLTLLNGAMEIAVSYKPDLILLDLALPDGDGFDFCRAVRANPIIGKTAIAILSIRDEAPDVVAGLEVGADDYVSKADDAAILLARIRNLLKRRQVAINRAKSLQCGDIFLDTENSHFTIDGSKQDLTYSELRVMELLMQSPGRVFSRDQIVEFIHGPRYKVGDRAIDVIILALRRKLNSHQKCLVTVRGSGYMLKA